MYLQVLHSYTKVEKVYYAFNWQTDYIISLIVKGWIVINCGRTGVENHGDVDRPNQKESMPGVGEFNNYRERPGDRDKIGHFKRMDAIGSYRQNRPIRGRSITKLVRRLRIVYDMA